MDTHASPHSHVNRVEDTRLITGHGKYAADWNATGQLYAHFVRADRAHAEIVSIDTAQALAQPGVKLVLTGRMRSRWLYQCAACADLPRP